MPTLGLLEKLACGLQHIACGGKEYPDCPQPGCVTNVKNKAER